MIVAAAGELQGAVPQPSSRWPLFPRLLKDRVGNQRCSPCFPRVEKAEFPAWILLHFLLELKTCVRIKHTLEEMEKEWEAGSALAELEERCPHSQSQLGSVQGVRT